MATTSSPAPILFSVLSSSHDQNDDFVNQLRNHLTHIETNVQQTLNKIQHRKPYETLAITTNQTDPKIRNNFFDVLKDVAIKNNLPFDESFFRQQFIEKQNSPSSPKVDIVRAKPSITIDTNDHHLSPVNNARRSQFAPVLSSTPVHQTSPITPIPVDLSLATPFLTINLTDLPAIPLSAIVPQRANLTRPGGRPPRIPRAESATRQKKLSSPIKEETILAEEIHVTSKRRIKTKQEIIEDNIEVIIEQSEIMTETTKQVQATPLRGRKKKIPQEDINIPLLEPPPPLPATETEIIPKKTRGGRGKKKDEEEVKPTRTASLVEPIINTEEIPPTTKVRATPSRGKKKVPEPTILSPPKKTPAKSRKRKENETPIDTIQPPSPKRRGGRNTKSKDPSPVETIITPPPLIEQRPVSTRSSRRGKKDIDIPIEKQEDIVLNKKPRTGRGKKNNQPIIADTPVTVVDIVMTSVISSVQVPSSSIDSLVAKPPRPPVARKKKSIAIPQMSPSTPPPTQRIQSTSPVNNKALLPIPVPTKSSRRRPQQRPIANSPVRVEELPLETLPSTTRNQKRTQSSVASTPKRARRDNLIVAQVPGTPGKKRNKCTCEKRRNRICDICAAAFDA